MPAAQSIMMAPFRTKPHGEQSVTLVEDSRVPGNRIYEFEDSQGRRMGFTGEEIESLIEWWRWERQRPGLDGLEAPLR